MLDDEEIKEIILKDMSLEQKVTLLVDGANEAGGSDNITVLLINFDENNKGGEIE
jgi:protein phosphatase